MIRPGTYLDEQDRTTFQTIVAFLEKRLTAQSTIDWALRLKPSQRIERLAIDYVLNGPGGKAPDEPWGHAWRLIEESVSAVVIERHDGTAIYDIQERLRAGDRSGAIVSAIVSLVAPRLKVEPIGSWRGQFVKKRRRPKTFDHLLRATLTSGDLIDLNVLELAALTEIPFLNALANALEAAINNGLDIARRIGWDGQGRLWQLGELGRVYYVTSDTRTDRNEDPDAYNHGIAPAVKLLHAVVARIADLEMGEALPFVHRWWLVGSPVHIRLWAAVARNTQLASAEEISAFFLGLDNGQFWDLHTFPEIAELRATRFRDLDQEAQKAIAIRLRKGPPRNYWPRKAEADKVKNARLYWAVRELKRIQAAGCELPVEAKSWLEAHMGQFGDLATMTIDEGFFEGPTVRSVPPNPDERYDTLEGAARLHALESALSTSNGGWNDNPADRASDWLRLPEKTALVLGDLEAVGNGGNEFPCVWDRFGQFHSPKHAETATAPLRNLQVEADRVLALLELLTDETLSAAIDGVSHWLTSWSNQVVTSPSGLPVWSRTWPFAVEATNARQETEDDADLSVTARAVDDDREPTDLDTLNNPAGKLVGVFLSSCPSLAQEPNPFAAGSTARQMRDAVILATGRSGLVARHRLIELLPYFLMADRTWAKTNLITPLLNDDTASLAFWRAVARRTRFNEVLKIIGGEMAERATDHRLGRESRRSLVFSLVIESMHAFRENREPAVANSRVTQTLRSIDDEVRTAAANAIQQFVRDLSTKRSKDENASSPENIFRSAAAPLLQKVWPQERSLATPGVSSAFSDLPATSGDAFAEAVEAIERFLVPFDCWSMLDYGLYGDDNEEKKLSAINDGSKAIALLRLLDLTVGSSEGAVVPHDLTDALDQIRSVTPAVAENPVFRRLSTAARR